MPRCIACSADSCVSDPDPLELLHCHIARQPAWLATVAPDPPPRSLARIVHKLLSKTPEERYQSCPGLSAGSAALPCSCCRQQNAAPPPRQAIVDFAIASRDRQERFALTQRLHGRRSESICSGGAVARVAGTHRAPQS